MTTIHGLNEETFVNILKTIELQKYDIPQIKELVYTLKMLRKIDTGNRNLTIRFAIHYFVSRNIFNAIKNLDGIFETIHKLIDIDIKYNKRSGNEKNNYEYILEN